MITIYNFQKAFQFLSNFYHLDVPIFGCPTVEHYYQSKKALYIKDRILIMKALTPADAKKLGRKVKIRKDWELIKNRVMRRALIHKFLYNQDLRQRLLNTKDARLIEGNYWHDNYWGDCVCQKCHGIKGKNMLGYLLMEVREQMRLIEEGRNYYENILS